MKGILLVTYLVNIVALVAAYGVFGLFLAVGSSALAYFGIQRLVQHKQGLAENAAIIVVHLLGPFAINSLFHIPALTLTIGVLEVVLLFIFILI